MTQFQRLARGAALAVAAACVFAGTLAGWSSVSEARKSKPGSQASQPGAPSGAQAAGPQKGSQGPTEDPAQKAQDQIAARTAYDAGLKAYANGQLQPAIDQFSKALNTGGLSPPEMAKALYTRGLAYKKQSRPGLAISDLTSALWLKNGLSNDDRAKATAERGEAYRMAGIEDPGDAAVRMPVADANSGANASSAGLSAAAIAQAAAPNSGSGSPSAAAHTTYTPPIGNGLQSAASATVVGSGTAPPAQTSSGFFGWFSPAEAAGGSSGGSSGTVSSSLTETAPAAPAQTSSTSTLSGVFGNLFGGGSSAPAPQPTANVTTASVEPATSSWIETTTTKPGPPEWVASVATSNAAKKSKLPAPVALATPSRPLAATKGKYKVHIAALRSRAEAEALAQKIAAQHGADLQNHVPTVDEAVIGSMGTFYRVRIPGYASQDEPRGLCNKLRSSGLDCLVVTN